MSSIDCRLEEVLQGYVSITEHLDGYEQPVRFYDPQIIEYTKNPEFLLRSYASAGMCIHIVTDASEISFDYRVSPGSAVDRYSFDTMVDGLLYRHQSCKISEHSVGTFSVALPGGIREVRIYLPNLARIEIRNIRLLNAGFFTRPSETKKVLIVGDSITQGYISEFPSLSFPAITSRLLNAELLNQAIGGEQFHAEVFECLFPWKPTHIISCYGTNEWANKSREVFVSEGKALFRTLSRTFPGVPTAVVTPIWRANKDTRRADNLFPFEDADRLMCEMIAEYDNMFIIHGSGLMPAIPEFMQDDVLHPNDLGNVVYGKRLYDSLPDSWKQIDQLTGCESIL